MHGEVLFMLILISLDTYMMVPIKETLQSPTMDEASSASSKDATIINIAPKRCGFRDGEFNIENSRRKRHILGQSVPENTSKHLNGQDKLGLSTLQIPLQKRHDFPNSRISHLHNVSILSSANLTGEELNTFRKIFQFCERDEIVDLKIKGGCIIPNITDLNTGNDYVDCDSLYIKGQCILQRGADAVAFPGTRLCRYYRMVIRCKMCIAGTWITRPKKHDVTRHSKCSDVNTVWSFNVSETTAIQDLRIRPEFTVDNLELKDLFRLIELFDFTEAFDSVLEISVKPHGVCEIPDNFSTSVDIDETARCHTTIKDRCVMVFNNTMIALPGTELRYKCQNAISKSVHCSQGRWSPSNINCDGMDVPIPNLNPKRKQYESTNLTYEVILDSRDRPSWFDEETVMNEIKAAFEYWSRESSLEFTYWPYGPEVNITIEFTSKDEIACGDRDGILGCTWKPPNRYIFFDITEDWTINDFRGTNIFQVATHEIGHALGLRHSTNDASVMQEFHPWNRKYFRTAPDDIRDIQKLYGSRKGRELIDEKGTVYMEYIHCPDKIRDSGCMGKSDYCLQENDGLDPIVFSKNKKWGINEYLSECKNNYMVFLQRNALIANSNRA